VTSLGWSADECAEILDTTAVSIESGCGARARRSHRERRRDGTQPDDPSTLRY